MSRSGVAVPSSNRWLQFILLIVIGFLAFSAWTFHRASQGTSAVIDSDYYNHGLRFNQTILEQKAAATLGWQVHFDLTDRQLQVRLLDHLQQPVTAVRGTLTVSGGRHGEVLRLPMTESRNGTYTCRLPDMLHGEETVQIDFQSDGAALSKQLLIALP